MEHVVFFPGPDGSPAFRRVPDLEEAVRAVEHLRNVEGVADVRVHPLGDEVPLAFRTWYRVEVPAAAAAPAPAEPVAVVPPQPEAPAEPQAADSAPAEAPAEVASEPAAEPGANGSAPVASLGFFAT